MSIDDNDNIGGPELLGLTDDEDEQEMSWIVTCNSPFESKEVFQNIFLSNNFVFLLSKFPI
jgi:hypothetical protein